MISTDLHIYILDAVPPVYVISNHVDTDKLTVSVNVPPFVVVIPLQIAELLRRP